MVSAIIPARNAAATLADTLDSLANQTHSPDEVIVVDDGSVDDTAGIADAHPLRPRIIKGGGVGPAAAINLASRQTTAVWLAPLDADDIAAPRRIEACLEAAAGNTSVIAVVGRFRSFYDRSVTPAQRAAMGYRTDERTALLPGGVMIRRDAFLACGSFRQDIPTGFFVEFWDRLRLTGQPVVTIEECVLHRRLKTGSLSHRAGSRKSEIDRDFLKAVHTVLKRKRETRDGD